MPEGEGRVKNLVHEMEVWKQRCAGELITQKNWDATWGFLKTPRKEEDGPDSKALRKVFEKFDMNRDGTMSVYEFSKMLVTAPGEAAPFKAICKFFCKCDSDANFVLDFNEFIRMAAALKAGKLPGIGPIDIVTMKRPSPSEMLEQSSNQDMPKNIQKMLKGDGEEKQDDGDGVPTAFKQRLDKLKPPRERFSHPVTTQQEVGWHKPIEMFGVGHHARKAAAELWAEKNPHQHKF
jgi:hypothetical protein